jgi:putative membrane protein
MAHLLAGSTAAFCIVLVTGCAGLSASARTTSAQVPGVTGAGGVSSTSDREADGEIATIADASYVSLEDAARVALSKAANPKVRRFAHHMLAAHGQARREQQDIAQRLGLPAVPSPASARLEAEDHETVEQIHVLSGDDFDRAYLTAQVKQITALIDTLNRELLPSVRSVELRSYLEIIRAKESMHAMEAEDVARSLR